MAGVTAGTVTAYFKIDLTGMHTGIAQAKTELNTFARSLQQQANQPMNQLARDASRNMALVGTATAAGLGMAVKAAAQFDQAMRNVNSIAQIGEKQFQDLKTAVMGLTKDPSIRQGPTDLAKGLYDVYSSGFTGAKAMDILRTSALGASAGMTDTATASRVLMAVLNSGIKGVTSTKQAMDVLFQEVNLGVNTFEGLANALGDVLPTAKVAGVSLQEVTAALAVMTRRGININESVTALNQMLVHLIKPGKEAQKMMDSLGISYGVNAVAAQGLTGKLAEIIEKTKGNKQALTLLMPEIRGMKGLMVLTDEAGRSNIEMLKGMDKATEGVGMSQKAANEQMKGGVAQFEKLKQQVEATAIEIGNTLLPEVNKLLKWTRDQLDAFNKLPSGTKTAITEIAAIGAVSLVAAGSILTLTTRVIELRNALVAAGLLGKLGALGAAGATVGGIAAGGYLINKYLPTAPGKPITEEDERKYRQSLLPPKPDLRYMTVPQYLAAKKAYDAAAAAAPFSASNQIKSLRNKLFPVAPPPGASTQALGASMPGTDPAAAKKTAKDAADAAKEAAEKRARIASAESATFIDLLRLNSRTYEADRAQARVQAREKLAQGENRIQTARWLKASIAKIDAEERADKKRHQSEMLKLTAAMGAGLSEVSKGFAALDEERAKQRAAAFRKMLQDTSQGLGALKASQRMWLQVQKELLAPILLEREAKQVGDAMRDMAHDIEAVVTGLGKVVEDQMRNRMSRAIKQAVRETATSLNLLTEVFRAAADEIYYAFAGQLEKLFGGMGTLGKIIQTAITRFLSKLLDAVLDAWVDEITRKKPKAEQGVQTLGSLLPIPTGAGFMPMPGGIPGMPGGYPQMPQGRPGWGSTGAQIGSLFGPVGAMWGAGIGGLMDAIGIKFQRGGWVPGPIDAPRPAIVHGGEFVVSREMMRRPSANITMNVHAAPGMNTEELARRVAYHTYRLMPVRPGS